MGQTPGGCPASLRKLALEPLHALIEAHVLAAERLHGDDTTVPILAKGKTVTGRIWTYVRDDRPFGGTATPTALYDASRDRGHEHLESHLQGFAGILQADAYSGYNPLYDPSRAQGVIKSVLCWSHYLDFVFMLSGVLTPQFRPTTCGRRSPHKFWSFKATGGTRAGLAWVSRARPERAQCRRGPRSYRARRVSFGGLWPGIGWSSQRWRARDSRV